MAHIVIMPKQGLQMTEGTIIKWYYTEGDAVRAGMPLFSMETDKLTIDIDADEAGTLLKIIRKEGEIVPITEPIAVIGEKGEDISAIVGGFAAPEKAAEPVSASAETAPTAIPEGVTPVIMPKQGLQMTEGTIIKWYHKEGESAEEGKPLFSMETDKLTIDIDAPATGTVLKILAEEGTIVPITETIAYIGNAGTAIPERSVKTVSSGKPAASEEKTPVETVSAPAFVRKPGQRLFISPRAKMKARDAGIDPASIPGSGPDGMVIERDVISYLASRPKASPVASVVAAQNGVDLNTVKGTGVNGKIMKEDVLNAMKPAETAPVKTGNTSAEAPAFAETNDETVIPIRGMRKAIFNNMMNSLHGMAQANHRMKVDMTECKRLREALKAAGQKVSFNDILILAVTKALLKHPCVNACTDGTNIYEKHYTNIGLAVAVENGLMVPNIKHTEKMTLSEIAAATAEQVKKTRDGKLTMEDYTGGTFTVTNLGMFDVDEFTPVINAPEAAILGVGKIGDTPVAWNGQVVIRPIMTLSLTYDHRIINGAPAAEFLQDLKKLLEQPYLML